MAQVFRVGTVGRLGVVEFEGLSRFLHEVHELVELEEAHEGVHEARKVAAHEA